MNITTNTSNIYTHNTDETIVTSTHTSPTISACLIVKNEEQYLHSCLQSIKNIVDEIIVVDTGSTDSSKEIALQYTNILYEIQWNNDFSYARNYGIQRATCDWILIIDADEEFCGTRQDLQQLITASNQIPYQIKIISTITNDFGDSEFISYMPRLFPSKDYLFVGEIHEQLIHKNKTNIHTIITDTVYFIHKGYTTEQNKKKIQRNISILEKAVKEKKDIVKNLFYLAAEYKKNNEIHKTIKLLQKWLPLAIKENMDISYGVHIYLMSMYQCDKYNDAINFVIPYFSLFQHNPSCLTALSFNYLMLEQFDNALQYAHNALQLLQDEKTMKTLLMIDKKQITHDAQLLIGSCYYYKKEYEKALTTFLELYALFRTANIAHKIIQCAIPLNKLDIIEQYVDILRTVFNDTSEATTLIYANLLFNKGKIKESILEFLKTPNGMQYISMLQHMLLQKQRFKDVELINTIIKKYTQK